jgi:HAD superfamily hydrolase (TIGR01509 family)
MSNGNPHRRRSPLPPCIRAAIFDFDETIVDLEQQHHASTAAICEELGADYMQMPASFRHSSGLRITDEVRHLREAFGWSQSVDELMEIRQRHFARLCRESDVRPLPGVEAVVRALHGRGLRLAITSSAVGDAIDALLRRMQLREFFELIIDGSDVVNAKPDPEPYLVTARRLELPVTQCIVFEDSQVGTLSAKAAGIFCVGVRNPRAKARQELDAADLVLDGMTEFDVSWITDAYPI